MRSQLEEDMIARITNTSSTTTSTPDPPAVETPLQRQILLWQRELLRRAERRQAGQPASGAEQ